VFLIAVSRVIDVPPLSVHAPAHDVATTPSRLKPSHGIAFKSPPTVDDAAMLLHFEAVGLPFANCVSG
jgi:hypothetical protein